MIYINSQEKYQIQGELQTALQITQIMMQLMQGEQLVQENNYQLQGSEKKNWVTAIQKELNGIHEK